MTLLTVRLIAPDGAVVGALSASPPVLPPPAGISAVARGPIVEWRIPRGAQPVGADRSEVDQLVGSLPCVTGDVTAPSSGQLVVQHLVLPPPSHFVDGSVETMWTAASELPGPSPASVLSQGLSTHSRAVVVGPGTRWSALPPALAAARHLLARWPRREETEEIWRPRDLPGGREWFSRTLRSPRARFDPAAGPLVTARLRASDAAWRSGVVAELGGLLSAELLGVDIDGELEPFTRAFKSVESNAKPEVRTSDTSPASWPRGVRRFYDLGLLALSQVAARGPGKSKAPLCRLWELYEAWVLRQLVDLFSSLVGHEPGQGPTLVGWADAAGPAPRPTWWTRWASSNATVDFWAQLRIGAAGAKIYRPVADVMARSTTGLPDVVAVTSDLIPDAMVVIRHRDRPAVIIVVDAKHRSGPNMQAGDAATAGAKYHWGLRSRPTDAPALTSVVLVTPAQPPTMHRPDTARILAVAAQPQTRELSSHDVLSAELGQLL